jgi:1-phosphofructokinase
MNANPTIRTVTLNPAVDRVIEVAGFQPGGHIPAQTTLRVAGGKGVNVSRVLAAMGVTSIADGFIGADNSRIFQAIDDDPHITTDFIVLDGSTRENITLIDTAAGSETHLRDRGLGVDESALRRLNDRLATSPPAGSLLVFSGSLPPGIDTGGFGLLIDTARDAGWSVVVDTSGAGLAALAGRTCRLIKPNAAELGELVGGVVDTTEQAIDAACDLTDRFEEILLSLGEEGAALIGRDGALYARAALPEDQVVNTVGCGDVLLGAYLAGLAGNLAPAGRLSQAVAASAASAAHPATATFEPELMEQLAESTEVSSPGS